MGEHFIESRLAHGLRGADPKTADFYEESAFQSDLTIGLSALFFAPRANNEGSKNEPIYIEQ